MIDRVNILGHDYQILFVKMPKRLYGLCDSDDRTIRINKRYPDEAGRTLVHEVVHASLRESGLVHLLHQVDGLEESIVRAIENGLDTAGLIPEVLTCQQECEST